MEHHRSITAGDDDDDGALKSFSWGEKGSSGERERRGERRKKKRGEKRRERRGERREGREEKGEKRGEKRGEACCFSLMNDVRDFCASQRCVDALCGTQASRAKRG